MTTTHTTDSDYVCADVFAQNLISDHEYSMLCNGYLPTYARTWITQEFGGIPSRVRRALVKVAQETPYQPDTAISIVYGIITQHKSLKKWIAANLKKSYQSIEPAKKVGNQWVDAQFTLWPPYMKPDAKSSQVNGTVHHVPARYVFKHKDIRVDLGSKDGKWNPVMHGNPNSAMQAVATRLGRRVGGDFNKVAQQLIGDEDLIVTSTTAKVGNQWVVLLSMMRDPQKTMSRFAVTESGGVISGDLHNPASSISETEYALIKGSVEEGDEETADYGYEFDEGLQAQLMLEDMSDKLDAETMSPTMFAVMDLASENDELIDFMSSSPVVDDTYLEIIDEKIEQAAKELVARYRLAAPNAPEHDIHNKAIYVARWMYEELEEAVMDAQRYVISVQPKQDFFTMKGSVRAKTRFFGVPSSYERVYMPAKNPVNDSTFLPVTEYVAPQGKVTEVDQLPPAFPAVAPKAQFRGKPSSICVNSNGNKATAPAKVKQSLSAANMSPRLAKVVFALELTNNLRQSVRASRSFA